jgi:hypothetical protein
MTDREFERRMVAAASNHAAGVRRDLAEISAEMRAADAALRRKRDAATLAQRTWALRAVLEVADQLRAVSAPARSAADPAARSYVDDSDRRAHGDSGMHG